MNWELAIKVATIVVGGLSLIEKGYELYKKRKARQRLIKKTSNPSSWISFLKRKLSAPISKSGNDLVLLSTYLGGPALLKKFI